MNSLINYQEAGSNLITIPATRRACLCPRWDTSRVYLAPKTPYLTSPARCSMSADHLEIPFRLVRAIFVYLTEIKQIISNILDKLAGQLFRFYFFPCARME